MKNTFNFFIFVVSVLILLSMQSCIKIDKTDFDQKTSIENNHTLLIDRAKKVTLTHKLNPIPIICLEFEVVNDRTDEKQIIVVREKHGDGCNGDPSTSPRLFSIVFDDKSNEVWSDAKSLLGQIEKISE